MKRVTKPTWIFPARNGGIDFVSDPSSAHFRDHPIPKLVRELVQNSLDAKDGGSDGPVTVTFSELRVKRKYIAGAKLERHLKSCYDRALTDEREDLARIYENAIEVLKQRTIPCLKVQDTGTEGLDESRWKALVVQEGAVSKSGSAPGGSYGIGKNAVLNVSDLNAVFYSTRYVAPRKGRVDKVQGKAILTGHPDPHGSGDDLQHIGFYVNPSGTPIMGRSVPDFYRLDRTGTAVFIMGFNPHSSDWVNKVATSVIENYFYAIHHQELSVRIVPAKGNPVHIDYQTIDHLFNFLEPINQRAVHYYRTIRDAGEKEIENTSRFRKLGKLTLFLSFFEGAPRHIAHINRNGMLITDSRDQRVNPLCPRGRSLWPDYVGVIIPDSNSGDLWLRKMENPSHDSMSSGQLLNENEQREAEERFKEVRGSLRRIIDDKAELESYGAESNLDELAELFPEMDNGLPSSKSLQTRQIESLASIVNKTQESQEDYSTGGGEGEDPVKGNVSEDSGGRGADEDGDKPVRRHQRRPILRDVRFIPRSAREAIVAFTPPGGELQEVNLSLIPTGADRHPGGDPERSSQVAIVEATLIGGNDDPIVVNDGAIVLTPTPGERVTIKVVVDGDLDRQAFRLV